MQENSTLSKRVEWVRPTLESGLRPTFGSGVRQTPLERPCLNNVNNQGEVGVSNIKRGGKGQHHVNVSKGCSSQI